MKKYQVIAVVISSLLMFDVLDATTWYVHPDSTLDCIQWAIDSCTTGDTVLVGPGTYYENIYWINTNGIKLISEYGPDTTVIDGASLGTVVMMTLSTLDSTTVIRGFTIQNGNATSHGGGGILCTWGSPTIEDNIITNNSTIYAGGGIGTDFYASPIIRNNIISGNTCQGGGGGIITIKQSSATITGNLVYGNTSSNSGGGICSYDQAAPIIYGNDIDSNRCNSGRGGGILCQQNSSPIIRQNCITRNFCSAGGSGIFCFDSASPVIDSNTIADNYNITAIVCGSNSNPVINYNNITNNMGYALVNNNTFWINAEYNWWGDSTGPYHPDSNPGGLGDSVGNNIDFIPWLYWPGVEEQPIIKPAVKQITIGATIFAGPLQLPESRNCKVFDITGRTIIPEQIKPGIYFIEVDGEIRQKVVKIR